MFKNVYANWHPEEEPEGLRKERACYWPTEHLENIVLKCYRTIESPHSSEKLKEWCEKRKAIAQGILTERLIGISTEPSPREGLNYTFKG